MNDDENKIREDESLSNVLRALPAFDAPHGFERSVTREIRARLEASHGSNRHWLKIAIPAAALFLLTIFFGLSDLTLNEIQEVAVIGESTVRDVGAHEAEIESGTFVGPTEQIEMNKRLPLANERARATLRVRDEKPADRAGAPYSVDLGGSAPSRPILPRGFDPDSKASNLPEVGQARSVKLLDVIRMLGIRGAIREDRFVVNSVDQNGPAMRVGIRAEDIIEAVNDVDVSGSATLSGRLELRSVRVKRGGSSIELKFK